MIDYIKNHIKESKEVKDKLLQDKSLLETINNIALNFEVTTNHNICLSCRNCALAFDNVIHMNLKHIS